MQGGISAAFVATVREFNLPAHSTNLIILSLALAAGSLTAMAGTPAPAPAPEPAPVTSLWSGSVTLGYDSKYIFRGLYVTDDLVTGSLDLNYTISDRLTLNLNAWYANGGGHYNTPFDGDYDELNLYVKLLYKVNDQFSFGPSFRYYDYPFDSSLFEQYEPGLEAVWLPCANTTVNMGVYYETESDALYAELGASYVYKVNDSFAIVPGAVISYLDRDDETLYLDGKTLMSTGYDTSGLNHAALYVKAPITLKSNVTLTPYVAYNMPLDTIEDNDGLYPGQDDQFYYGATLSVGF
jgi:hypothetical protein